MEKMIEEFRQMTGESVAVRALSEMVKQGWLLCTEKIGIESKMVGRKIETTATYLYYFTKNGEVMPKADFDREYLEIANRLIDEL